MGATRVAREPELMRTKCDVFDVISEWMPSHNLGVPGTLSAKLCGASTRQSLPVRGSWALACMLEKA